MPVAPTHFEIESVHWSRGLRYVAGVDEVGRGPLCGCVMAGATMFIPGSNASDFLWAVDSKSVPKKQMASRAKAITDGKWEGVGLLAWGIGAASPVEIDRLNIRQATHLAMRRAIRYLQRHLESKIPGAIVEHVLVDGNDVGTLPWSCESVVKGDTKSVSIAAASILAKDTRDRLMGRLAARYPDYHFWASNAGYGSPEHMQRLIEVGPIPKVHRYSFAPVAEAAKQPRIRMR